MSSFGIGGTNAHVVLEEAPTRPAIRLDPAGSDPPDLGEDTDRPRRCRRGSRAPPERPPGRRPRGRRLDAAGGPPGVRHALRGGRPRREASWRPRSRAARRAVSDRLAPPAPSVVFLFPGQGAQFAGMAEGLYRHEPVFRASSTGARRPSFRTSVSTSARSSSSLPSSASRRTSACAETAVTQPALFAVEYALARLWMSWGVTPAAMIGHSLGEYVAACLAGVFSRGRGRGPRGGARPPHAAAAPGRHARGLGSGRRVRAADWVPRSRSPA